MNSKFRTKKKQLGGFTKKMYFFRGGLNLSRTSATSNPKLRPRRLKDLKSRSMRKKDKSRYLTERETEIDKIRLQLRQRPALKRMRRKPLMRSRSRLNTTSKWEMR